MAHLSDGTCGDGLLVPNHNRTYCALAGRIDVGKHHIIGGGPTSKKLYIDTIKKQIGTVFFQLGALGILPFSKCDF